MCTRQPVQALLHAFICRTALQRHAEQHQGPFNCPAGLETAVTRTPLSTTLILANLSGHTGVIVPCLASAIVSLFLTLNQPFIAAQQDRADINLRVS